MIHIRIWQVIALGFMVATTGLAQEADHQARSTPEPKEAASLIIATVNGEPIYFEDLEQRLNTMHTGAQEATRAAFDLDQLMFGVVNDALLAQEARAMRMQNEAPIPKEIRRLREELAIKRLEQEEIWNQAEPSEQEIREAFEFGYRSATFRMLTTREKEKAEELLAELEQGADFETLVRQHSVDPYTARGGLVKNLPWIDIPRAIGAEVFSSEPGALIGPVRTDLGWTNLQIVDIQNADPDRFTSVEPAVKSQIRFRRAEDRRSELSEQLRSDHPAKVDWEVVNGITTERLPDSRLMPIVPDPDAIVVRVGDRSVAADAYGKALINGWKDIRNQEAALAAKPIVLDRLIRYERLLAEALARGYDRTPPVERAARAYETQQVIRKYLNHVAGAEVEVSPEMMETFYAEHKESFPRPSRLHLGQITVGEEGEAKKMADLIREGADLAWLARRYSIDRFKDAGGDRGWLVRGQGGVPREVFDLQPGDIFGPIGGEGEYVIWRVADREEQGFYSLDEVSERIRSAVASQQFGQALDALIKTLRSRSEIVINDDVLASLTIAADPDAEGSNEESHGH